MRTSGRFQARSKQRRQSKLMEDVSADVAFPGDFQSRLVLHRSRGESNVSMSEDKPYSQGFS